VGVVLEEVAMEANKLVTFIDNFQLSTMSVSLFLIILCSRSKTLLAVDDFDGCFNPTFIKLGRNEWV
jgi:hypothetical protein